MTDKIVKPIHAREGEVIDIHWHLKNGTVLIERRTTPPAATQQTRTTEPSE